MLYFLKPDYCPFNFQNCPSHLILQDNTSTGKISKLYFSATQMYITIRFRPYHFMRIHYESKAADIRGVQTGNSVCSITKPYKYLRCSWGPALHWLYCRYFTHFICYKSSILTPWNLIDTYCLQHQHCYIQSYMWHLYMTVLKAPYPQIQN